MKFTVIIKKNLKLLMRARSSALIVVFGPLLIILLVGLALNNPTPYELTIGYYTPDANNPLTESFMEEVRNNNFIVTKYSTPEECIQNIKDGQSHSCIIFPVNFEIGKEGYNNIEFYVDYSRTNIVYQIIELISSEFDIRTSELSRDLTQVLLTKITDTKKDLDDNILSIITIKSIIDSIGENVDDTREQSEDLDFTSETISMTSIKDSASDLSNDAKDLKSEALAATSEGISFANTISNVSGVSAFKTEMQNIEENINSIYNNTPEIYEELEDAIENATEQIELLQDKLSEGADKNEEIINELESVKDSLESLKSNVNEFKTKIENTNTNLDNIDITSAESIVSPIKTDIKPILAEDTSQIKFLFPSLLVLLIMFIAIMLSSSLILMEKHSRAAFRNLITPTKQDYFVITTFITSLIVLLLQTIVIMGISLYFLQSQILSNIGLAIIIILLTISIFILIGMIIGYISGTQEAATMLSIAVGSVLLLLSNFILPIESMAPAMKHLTPFNPFVVSSEILKKIFLFKATILDVWIEIAILVAFAVILMTLTYIINALARTHWIKKGPHVKKGDAIYLADDMQLKIGSFVIKNEIDMLEALQKISEEEFNKHINKKNDFADWISKKLKRRKLAFELRTKNKEQMIKVLQKDIEKKQKKLKKKAESLENN